MKTLTVSKLFRPLRWESQFVPFLRISGDWLAEAGFHIGKEVHVRVENGELILTPVEAPSSARSKGRDEVP